MSAINFKSICLKGNWLQKHISCLHHMLQMKSKISAKYNEKRFWISVSLIPKKAKKDCGICSLTSVAKSTFMNKLETCCLKKTTFFRAPSLYMQSFRNKHFTSQVYSERKIRNIRSMQGFQMREITSSASSTSKVGPLRHQVMTENLAEIYRQIYSDFYFLFQALLDRNYNRWVGIKNNPYYL